MAQVNIYEAKTQLSRLVTRALAGEEIIVARAGVPLVRLVAVDAPRSRRPSGTLAGKIHIADDFDDTLDPEVLDAFYAGQIEPEDR